MGKATIVRADGTETELDHRPSLEKAQNIVGGYIELVKAGHNTTLVVDEEGRMKNQPVNNTITSRFKRSIYGLRIVGDVIVLEGWRTVGN
jgi:hypothetical protein